MVGWHLCWKSGVTSPTQVASALSKATLQPVAFEICSGAVSDALRKLGLQVNPIDHMSNRHSPKVRTLVFDVSKENHLSFLINIIIVCTPCYIHSGTCSRAREKPATAILFEVQRTSTVEAANCLYKSAICVLRKCFEFGRIISIENPKNSWLWPLLELYVHQTGHQAFINFSYSLERVTFSACAHGSDRNKQTTVLATKGVFTELALPCLGGRTGWMCLFCNSL